MAGHSKWANIKHRKAAQDSRRSKVFTKLAKEITVAAKEGGIDPETNARLRLAIQNARKSSVPKDVIDRALKRAQGGEGADYIEVTYEGYGPHGVAILVLCQTDNINRTVANVRSCFNKANGSLGTSGSVSYMFARKGQFSIKAPAGADPEEFMLNVIDMGAEDIEQAEDAYSVTTAFEDFGAVNAAFEQNGIEVEEALVVQLPGNTVTLDVDAAQKVLKLVDALEDDDDVQQVFHNLEMTDELAEALAG